MISISCTNCKQVLTIDDAFAGGVCRCQHCGTIQTVPAKLKPGDTIAHETLTGTALGGSRIVPSRKGGDVGMSSGLDELADIVASSGLAGSGLSSRRLQRPPGGNGSTAAAPAAAQKKSNLPMIAIGAAVGLAVVLLAVILAMRSGNGDAGTRTIDRTDTGSTNSGSNNASVPTVARGPNFCGTSLGSSQSVVYVLDRGSGTRDVFDALKQATLKSAESLGPDRKFQIVFWANGQDEVIIPAGASAYATPERIADVRKKLDDVTAYGATEVKPALQRAVTESPDAIVIATGKGADLGDDFAAAVDDGRRGSSAKLYTFSVGEGDSEVLKRIARIAGGEYAHVDSNLLDRFAR